MSVLPFSPPLYPFFPPGGGVVFLFCLPHDGCTVPSWLQTIVLKKIHRVAVAPSGKADPDVDHCNLPAPVAPVGNLCPRIMYPCILCSILSGIRMYFCTPYYVCT